MKVVKWLTRKDTVSILIILGVALMIWTSVAGIRQSERLVPQVVSLFMALVGMLFVISTLRTPTPGEYLRIDRAEFVVLLVAVLAALLIGVTGFYSAVFLLMFFTSLYLYRSLSVGSVFRAVVYSTAVTAVMVIVFRVSLGMITPRGLLF